MIEINMNVKNYHECSFCNNGTKATHNVLIKTSPNDTYTIKMCDHHVCLFGLEAEKQFEKCLNETEEKASEQR